jgi:CheY-like chemotaxis protein
LRALGLVPAVPPRLLIVDDAADLRDLYAAYFTMLGFHVTTAHDGESGIAAAQAQPDVIVMDIAMPRVDGITATRHLKSDQRTQEVPIIVLTAHSRHVIERRAREAGADVVMTKPCFPEDLEAEVQRQLHRRGRAAA